MQTALFFQAIQDGDLQTVHALLRAQPDLAAARNPAGLSPIMVAAYHRHADVLRELVEHSPTLDIFDAAISGDLDRTVTLTKEHPSIVDTQSSDGFSPLGFAAFFGHIEIVAFLLEQGADANVPSRNRMHVYPIHSAAAANRPDAALAMVAALIEHDAEVNVRQHGGWTPLHQASASGNVELVHLLVRHGADTDAASDSGLTPFEVARKAGHVDLLALLTPEE